MQRRKSGNIMLLVLFIMFITSMMGLLVSQYVKNMITVSGLFSQYYTTYFYAYGGLELGLTQVKYHNFWFEDSLVYTGFGSCPLGVCEFDMTIDSRNSVIANSYEDYTWCTAVEEDQEMYVLQPGDCFITPLFYDISTWFNDETYDDLTFTDLLTIEPALYNQYVSGWTSEPYIVKIVDEQLINYNVRLEATVWSPSPYEFTSELSGYSSSPDNKNFLIIANATGSAKEFCLETAVGDLVKNYVTIQSIGSNGIDNVSFGAVKAYQLPSFLCYGTINP